MKFSDKLDLLTNIMESLPCSVFVEVKSLSRDETEFINAIKYLIDYEHKPYEFSGDYSKVRRFEPYEFE